MKRNKNNATRNLFLTLLSMILISFYACADQGSKEKKNEHAEAPAMDLLSATLLGDLKTVNQHIDYGTDLNMKDTIMGSSALMTATVFDRRDIALALINAGADVNITNMEGSTALITASFLCRKEIVSLLLENGADKSINNIYGSNAYKSVEAPFESVRFIYDQFAKDLGPLGLKLDYDYLEETRPVIADMLK